MTATQTVKQYGEFAVTAARTPVLAVIGAGDLAVERAKTVVSTFRTKAEALPGEAQVQADLAAKEARTRATEAAGRRSRILTSSRHRGHRDERGGMATTPQR